MRRPLVFSLLLILLLPLIAGSALAQSSGRLGYYRFPSIHGDTLVFGAEGDLWTVPTSGGLAQRLTTHAAEERHPNISPDGATIAFAASYEGPVEVYTMPIHGGLPVRQTYESDSSVPIGWAPDGRLLYTTQHYSTLPNYQMVQLDLSAGTRELAPLEEASEASFNADGSALFFVDPAFHNNVTRRYRGGTARKIWRFSPGAAEAVKLTGDFDGESHSPMWWDGRVYFVSDRDGTMNVWSMAEDGTDARQHTEHSGWDVKDPALEGGRIAYQVGADIWIYDVAADDARMVPVTLASDFDQLRERWVKEPMSYLTSARLHPRGDSVVLTARGRVFVAPVGDGRLVRASRKTGVRYRDVGFMPDGGELLALSDETGELEFVTLPADGIGDGRALTDDGDILRFAGTPSPDGAWITFIDNNNDRTLLEVATGDQRVISTNREGVGNAAWSPDSSWLAYVQAAPNTYSQVWLYEPASGTRLALTSDRVNSFSPVFSPDGDWLYFLSDRNLRSLVGSPWGARQPEPYFDRTMKIYQVSMQAGTRSPFQPDDELSGRADGNGDGAGGGGDNGSDSGDGAAEGEGGGAETPMAIDLDGIQQRVREIPAPPGNYAGLSVNDGALFFSERETGSFRRHLKSLSIGNEGESPVTVVEGVSFGELSADGKKLLVRRGDDLFVFAARAAKADLDDAKVDLSGWTFAIDVAQDWRQIFTDAWRLERDYFYDPGMHGVAWDIVFEKYLELVGRITTRAELNDLIGRVIGELSALHTSVRGGDQRDGEDEVGIASLGARLFRDPAAGGYRIDHIYRGDPDFPSEWSPLAHPDLGVSAGDVIEAVNGVDALSVRHVGSLLRNQAGRQVLLRVRSGDESREIIVVPIGREWDLRYADWEVSRRQRVEEQGAGDIGYVHLRAMGSNDLTAWYRQFYPVFDRQGLILDMRRNRGGNIDSIILEKLVRQAWFYWKSRVGRPTWNMQYAFRGHMVVLVNETTASDGEAFAEGFRRLELGPVIGTRTWGGEIWLSSSNRLSDGGLARAPMSGVYGPEREWLIEGWGVVPDVEVDNPPHATFNGQDAQLDAAIAYLKQQIADDPRPVPAAPDYPDLGFRYPHEVTGGQGDGAQDAGAEQERSQGAGAEQERGQGEGVQRERR